MGAPQRTKCSLAGEEGIPEDFLEEAGIPDALEWQTGVWKVRQEGGAARTQVWPRECTRREG